MKEKESPSKESFSDILSKAKECHQKFDELRGFL